MTTMEKLIKLAKLSLDFISDVVRDIQETAEYYVERYGSNMDKIKQELDFDKTDFDSEDAGDLYTELVIQTCKELVEKN